MENYGSFVTAKPVSRPRPAGSYEEALQRLAAWTAQEDAGYNDDCRTYLMTHGGRAERVIVFAHGYTNCPKQFVELGKAFYEKGYNVLVPPLPYHGLADRMTQKQASLTAQSLARYADAAIDIARGLGDEVVMAGLSGGGVTTAWAAQYRSDIDLAVPISPALGVASIPTRLTALAARLFRALPNFYKWWDPVLKESVGPSHGYPRIATHALAEIMYLGSLTLAASRREPPAARSVLIVTNASDTSINNELVARYVENLRRLDYKGLRTYEFEAALRLEHDLIDPSQPNQRIDLVYPKLVELITQDLRD